MAGLVSVFSLLAFLLAAAISLTHAEHNPPAIFVFGDSLSDVGSNNNVSDWFRANYAHYGVDFPGGVPTGRFTNGYNFIDIIAQQMGFELSPPAYGPLTTIEDMSKGVNFASGGSGILVGCMNGTTKKCITMEEQIKNFKRTRFLLQLAIGRGASIELITKSIFIFTCGGNDLNNFFWEHFLHNQSAPIDEYVANLTSTFRDQLKELYSLGGRKFAIINVPALGMTPTARALDVLKIVGIDVQKVLNGYADKFNEAEYMMLEKLASTLPMMKYSIGNAYSALMDVTTDPEKHGMKNVTSPCCGEVYFDQTRLPPLGGTPCSPPAPLCSNRSEFVFWDQTHPTQAVIEYAGKLFYSGNYNYAKPINLKQLVEDDSLNGAAVSLLGSFEVV